MSEKRRFLPDGMLRRWPSMLVWITAVSFSSFGALELASSTAFFAIVAVLISLGIVALWGARTRPSKNAFWFLVHILLIAGLIAFATTRPLLGFVAALPVALFWLHDSPASPSTMMLWGFILAMLQPDFWSQAEPEHAWDVLLVAVLVIAAAQIERNRLAARQYTQAGPVFSLIRLAAVAGLSFLFIAGREGLRAVNAFTYLGIDASGLGGKLTMIGFIAISLAAAVALFRVRPEKPPKLAVASASKPRQAIDFDSPSTRKKIDEVTKPGQRLAQSTKQRAERAAKTARAAGVRTKAKAPKKSSGPAQPGELDFD